MAFENTRWYMVGATSLTGGASGFAYDLSGSQFRFVVQTTAAGGGGASAGVGVYLPTSAAQAVDGVLENKPGANTTNPGFGGGFPCSVAIAPSVVKVVCSTAIAQGQLVMSTFSSTTPQATTPSNAGMAAPATTGNFAVGRALDTTTQAGQLVTVQLMPFGKI